MVSLCFLVQFHLFLSQRKFLCKSQYSSYSKHNSRMLGSLMEDGTSGCLQPTPCLSNLTKRRSIEGFSATEAKKWLRYDLGSLVGAHMAISVILAAGVCYIDCLSVV